MVCSAVKAAGLTAELDAVLSVDTVKMFKPRPEVYALVIDHFKCAPNNVTFVSSNRWDIMGAVSFGFGALWLNRGKMPDEYADYSAAQTIGDLTRLTG